MSSNKVAAKEIAMWFIDSGYDRPRDTFDGNMKLQKLLYFAQLIHLAETGDTLFDDSILAFENGSVVEEVRKAYRNNFHQLFRDVYNQRFDFTQEQLKTLQTTVEIFGDVSASELSDINHMHLAWREALENSLDGKFHLKERSEIKIDSIIKYDLENIREMLKAYEMAKGCDEKAEVVNGITFYYNPNEIEITEDVLKELEAFRGDESAYVIYKDINKGMVIY